MIDMKLSYIYVFKKDYWLYWPYMHYLNLQFEMQSPSLYDTCTGMS